MTSVFAGITCEHAPGQEELAQLLAERFAARNREAAESLGTPVGAKAAQAVLPLSPADLRQNRAAYLAAICAQLALATPTPWQEECYDAFLNNYESHMRVLALAVEETAVRLNRIDKITIWERAELVRRLEAGEKINGFSYDPVTKKGNAEFRPPSFDLKDPRLLELAEQRKRLTRDYEFRMSHTAEGDTLYQASASSSKRSEQKISGPDKTAGAVGSAYYPVILTAEVAALPVSEQGERLWESSKAGAVKAFFDAIARMRGSVAQVDPVIAGLVLHETTEVGIVDRYYRGKDRRWFCDGVANYVPWRVVRDRQGAGMARKIYDVDAQTKQYVDLAAQVDLRTWAAVENQSRDEQGTRLNRARYAFAARAIYLMQAQAGDDALPRLFNEVGRTHRDKVSFTTVEKAWKKIAGGKLETLLAEAERLPMSATP